METQSSFTMELSAIVLSCLAAIILCIIKLPHVLVVDAVYTVLGGACTLWYTADVLNEVRISSRCASN